MSGDHRVRIVLCAAFALVAFAANSLLCRVALRQGLIDPASFTTIRLISGAAALVLITGWRRSVSGTSRSAFLLPALLALYAVPFSFAYVGLSVGTGALVLFGSVQITMLGAALRLGERVLVVQWAGLALAVAGVVYLVLPSLATPAILPALLMAVAGISWGLYSWRGRDVPDPLIVTARNFVLATPLVLLVSLAALARVHVEAGGVILSVASGAIASGLGYVVWYAALPGLTGMQAAVMQLAVPVIAAAGGVVFLTEAVTGRLVISTILVLGGVALAIVGRERLRRREQAPAA